MNQNINATRSVRLALILTALCGALASARAQNNTGSTDDVGDLVQGESYVVSATRSTQDPRHTPSAVSVVPLDALRDEQVSTLGAALAREPGLYVSTAGPTGGQTSVFMRGANSDQTLFVVDGVRINDRSTSYVNFLGGADLGGFDRVEVLRGPQSTLYGSSAMGGMVYMTTAHGQGAPSAAVTAHGGSFDTLGGSLSAQGAAGGLGYSASLARFQTDNDQPKSGYEQWSYATRLEANATDALLLGATFRGQNGELEQTGSRFFPSPGLATEDSYLATAYAEAKVNDALRSRLTLALHRRIYDWTDLSGSPWATNSALRNRRTILDWQNTWAASDRAEVVAGANFERSRYDVNGVPSNDDVAAGFVTGTMRATDDVTLIGGLRHDSFDSVGDATTWHTGVAWRTAPNTKLRATYGTGFGAPGSDDRYGVAAWGQLPNPTIRPEKSRGWDAGIEQTLADGKTTVSATYFRNRFKDLFQWQTVNFVTFQGRTENVARATTEGIELAVDAKPAEGWAVRAGYTYLEAKNDSTGLRLIRRPRHSGTVDTRWQATSALLVGAGLRFAANRTESAGPFESYTTVRVFASYAVTPELRVEARLENALDESYEDVRGYAALPRGVFAGLRWDF